MDYRLDIPNLFDYNMGGFKINIMKAIICVRTNDEPKIYPTTTGARIELEVYNVSVDKLLALVGKELEVEIKES